jgi:hypothetical protein
METYEFNTVVQNEIIHVPEKPSNVSLSRIRVILLLDMPYETKNRGTHIQRRKKSA